MELLAPPARWCVSPSVGAWVGASVSESGLWLASPLGPGRRSPLLTLCLLEPPGEVVDAHVLELEQVLQAPHLHLQDLHSLLRGQQLLLLFSDLEDEARVALQCLTISRKSGRRQPAPPGVGSSLTEARTSGPTLTRPMSLGQAFPHRTPHPTPPHSCLPRNSLPLPLPASPV